MIDKIPPLMQLAKQLQYLPYLASKNLYRVMDHLLLMDVQKVQQLCTVILQARESLMQCQLCCVWKEKDKECIFCSSNKRDQTIICVVETWQELLSIEKTAGYQGLYHILGGTISPLHGIGPEDLSIDRFLGRLNNSVKEIILAMNQTPEGEVTATYCANKIKGAYPDILISCLARGVPVGATLEGMDRLTVCKALAERRPF